MIISIPNYLYIENIINDAVNSNYINIQFEYSTKQNENDCLLLIPYKSYFSIDSLILQINTEKETNYDNQILRNYLINNNGKYFYMMPLKCSENSKIKGILEFSASLKEIRSQTYEIEFNFDVIPRLIIKSVKDDMIIPHETRITYVTTILSCRSIKGLLYNTRLNYQISKSKDLKTVKLLYSFTQLDFSNIIKIGYSNASFQIQNNFNSRFFIPKISR